MNEEQRVRNRERAHEYYWANRDKILAKLANGDPALKSEYNREYHAKNKKQIAERKRDWRLQKEYGISYEDKRALLKSQGYVCAACGADDPGSIDKGWAVDHCHDTGVIRGLLCLGCNTSIGLLKESPARLLLAAAYLVKHGRKLFHA